MNPTHQIVSTTKKKTSSGSHWMWECQCADGERVWAVQHSDMAKDSFGFFAAAGFGETLDRMKDGERLTWKMHPIHVELVRDGKWWRLAGIVQRIEGQVPDANYAPNKTYWKRKAAYQARLLVNNNDVVCFDTETTGVDNDAEIISFGAVDGFLHEQANMLIRPMRMHRVAATTPIHGITVEQLDDAPSFRGAFMTVAKVLADKIWTGYNVNFDRGMVDYECERLNVRPIVPRAVVDVMELVSWYRGEWDDSRGQWRNCKLSEAAEALGVVFQGMAHDALSDCATTMLLLREMAAYEPEMNWGA